LFTKISKLLLYKLLEIPALARLVLVFGALSYSKILIMPISSDLISNIRISKLSKMRFLPPIK
jgi:hypothetical protein